MRLAVGAATAIVAMCLAPSVVAQPATASAGPAEAAPAVGPASSDEPPTTSGHVAAGTPVLVEIAEPVSSRALKPGDKFALRLASPILLDGRVIVPAGVAGVGEVIDAAPSGAFGKPAKLLLGARYLEFDGAQIRLRTLRLGKVGADRTVAIMAAGFVPYVGVLSLFIHGGEIEIPAGTVAQAKLVADLEAPAAAKAARAAQSEPSPIQP